MEEKGMEPEKHHAGMNEQHFTNIEDLLHTRLPAAEQLYEGDIVLWGIERSSVLMSFIMKVEIDGKIYDFTMKKKVLLEFFKTNRSLFQMWSALGESLPIHFFNTYAENIIFKGPISIVFVENNLPPFRITRIEKLHLAGPIINEINLFVEGLKTKESYKRTFQDTYWI